ncbi:unnamed protein product [Lactuca saligna]|uniref:Uncharacterized protein n=1 Tax=Lactuca saligna TaxID=75948 RepID=A0AA35ZQE9_LACSI|nr:unnamed protein product [Lactuca saligna]
MHGFRFEEEGFHYHSLGEVVVEFVVATIKYKSTFAACLLYLLFSFRIFLASVGNNRVLALAFVEDNHQFNKLLRYDFTVCDYHFNWLDFFQQHMLHKAGRNNVLLAVPAFLYAINNYLKSTMQVHRSKQVGIGDPNYGGKYYKTMEKPDYLKFEVAQLGESKTFDEGFHGAYLQFYCASHKIRKNHQQIRKDISFKFELDSLSISYILRINPRCSSFPALPSPSSPLISYFGFLSYNEELILPPPPSLCLTTIELVTANNLNVSRNPEAFHSAWLPNQEVSHEAVNSAFN